MTPRFGRRGESKGPKPADGRSPGAELERGLGETVADSRVEAITEELIGRVIRLRQAEAIIGELDEAIGRLRSAATEMGSPEEPLATAGPERETKFNRDRINEGLRLIVLKLAATGRAAKRSPPRWRMTSASRTGTRWSGPCSTPRQLHGASSLLAAAHTHPSGRSFRRSLAGPDETWFAGKSSGRETVTLGENAC